MYYCQAMPDAYGRPGALLGPSAAMKTHFDQSGSSMGLQRVPPSVKLLKMVGFLLIVAIKRLIGQNQWFL